MNKLFFTGLGLAGCEADQPQSQQSQNVDNSAYVFNPFAPLAMDPTTMAYGQHRKLVQKCEPSQLATVSQAMTMTANNLQPPMLLTPSYMLRSGYSMNNVNDNYQDTEVVVSKSIDPRLRHFLYGNNTDDVIRRRMYDNLRPYGYNRPIHRIRKAVIKNKTEYGDGEPYDPFRDDFWAKYLQIPQGERHHDYVDNVVVPSQYKPTKGDENGSYMTITGLFGIQDDVNTLIDCSRKIDHGETTLLHLPMSNKLSPLGKFTLSRGVDPNKGEYVSVYDKWNINPTFGDAAPFPFSLIPIKGDATFGIGKPFEIYDRLYLDDFYQIDSKPDYDSYYGGYLPPAIKEEKQGKKR